MSLLPMIRALRRRGMQMSRRSAFTLCIIAAGLLGGLSAAQADIIGETASAKNHVTGELGSQSRPLVVGTSVSGDERVPTGIASATLLRFRDNT